MSGAGRTWFRWTDDRVALLTRLWREPGLTRAAMAARIGGGCTTSKVMGKAHRLRLPDRRQGVAGGEGRVERLSPAAGGRRAGPRTVYARRFLTAGWPPREVAWLFGLKPWEMRTVKAGVGAHGDR